MKQVFLSGTGQIEVLDVPLPGRMSGAALVRTEASLISSGTEAAAVTRHGGVRGVYEKLRASSDRVEEVWKLAQTMGYMRTLDLVRNKLNDLTPIGYSCAGRVVEASGVDDDIFPDTPVACMGAGFASHAEFVTVPRNLLVRIPDRVSTQEAAFGAVACIAMQGVRRLDLAPGERIGVIGLGLIGQICTRLLVAMGYQPVGMDVQAARAQTAIAAGVDAWSLESVDSMSRVAQLTGGRGLDGVIVCAGTSSDEPINLAFDLCRVRGRVSLVGDVGLGLRREKMYRKELELRISTSYGPGRYDERFEIKGEDYPFGHVRWTEKRNLEYFLNLIAAGRLDVRSLISAEVPVDHAPDAYSRVKSGGAETYGVVLRYAADGAVPPRPAPIAPASARAPRRAPVTAPISLGLIGVGGFAKAVHMPNLAQLPTSFRITAVASRSGATAGVVARKLGVTKASGEYQDMLNDSSVDAVLISTRHASHARIVIDALNAGKHVFVEKPMTTTTEDARRIVALADATGLVVRVGFNRRYAPYLRAMRDAVGASGARMFTCRVNIGRISNDWSNTEEEGGRLMGEGVHFFDLCNWFVGAAPTSLRAAVSGAASATNPNVGVSVSYADGSVAQLMYTSFGSGKMGKEYYEAFGNGRSARMNDFMTFEAFGSSASAPRSGRGDKGQLDELREFAAAVSGKPASPDAADARAGLLATWMAEATYESARQGADVRWSEPPIEGT